MAWTRAPPHNPSVARSHPNGIRPGAIARHQIEKGPRRFRRDPSSALGPDLGLFAFQPLAIRGGQGVTAPYLLEDLHGHPSHQEYGSDLEEEERNQPEGQREYGAYDGQDDPGRDERDEPYGEERE